MYMSTPFPLGLTQVELTQLKVRLCLTVELIVLEPGALAKPRTDERLGKIAGSVQIRDSDLYVNDVLGAKPGNGRRADVIDTNRSVVEPDGGYALRFA